MVCKPARMRQLISRLVPSTWQPGSVRFLVVTLVYTVGAALQALAILCIGVTGILSAVNLMVARNYSFLLLYCVLL